MPRLRLRLRRLQLQALPLLSCRGCQLIPALIPSPDEALQALQALQWAVLALQWAVLALHHLQPLLPLQSNLAHQAAATLQQPLTAASISTSQAP